MPDTAPLGSARADIKAAALPTSGSVAFFVALGVVAVLYFGRDVFVPMALAVLLSFVLAPLTVLLRKSRIGRKASAVAAVVLAFVLIFGLGAIMAGQISQLSENLPQYESTVRTKIRELRGMNAGGGAVERASEVLRDLGKELESGQADAPPAGAARGSGARGTAAPAPVTPLPVEIRQPNPAPMQMVQNVLGPLLGPLATMATIVLFALLILLYREDLRDRVIRLVGAHDLQRTTAAMDDAALRLSRYFLIQTGINAACGVIAALGLWFIGVPNPVLWGIISGMLRFVPYVGFIAGAALPALLAVAVDPGWSMLIWVVALFLVTEAVLGQVVEPWLYGASTGLSPIAVVAAATFWTWLWGPIGLLLAVPLTVCVVVLGRHVERLEFLDVMLGDRPALTPAESFYQRMLAGDPVEAAEQAELFLQDNRLGTYYDEVAVRGLILARVDSRSGSLDEARMARIKGAVDEVIEDLADHDDVDPEAPILEGGPVEPEPLDAAKVVPAAPVLAAEELLPAWREGQPVLCIGARDPLDGAAAAMLAQLLEKHGVAARVEQAEAVRSANIGGLDPSGVRMVCLSYVDAGRSPASARYLVRRMRRKLPGATILSGFWNEREGSPEFEALRKAAGADLYATSLRDAVLLCVEAARGGTPVSDEDTADRVTLSTRPTAA